MDRQRFRSPSSRSTKDQPVIPAEAVEAAAISFCHALSAKKWDDLGADTQNLYLTHTREFLEAIRSAAL